MNRLLLLTKLPHDPLAWQALQHAETTLDETDTQLRVFFYQDAVTTANTFMWQPADQLLLREVWQKLAIANDVKLPVCVSAALARGVTDDENAKRHKLTQTSGELANNLAECFSLVGLGELAEAMHWADTIQCDSATASELSAQTTSHGLAQPEQSNAGHAKNVLIFLDNPNRLCLEEGISAGMVMASFDHHVQLALTEKTAHVLEDETSKAHKMLTSLELYDMPTLWVINNGTHAKSQQQGSTATKCIDIKEIAPNQLESMQTDFDAVLTL